MPIKITNTGGQADEWPKTAAETAAASNAARKRLDELTDIMAPIWAAERAAKGTTKQASKGTGTSPVAFYATAKGSATYWAAEKARAAELAIPYVPSRAELLEAAAMPYPPSVADMQEAALRAPSVAERLEAEGATKMPSIVELAGFSSQYRAAKRAPRPATKSATKGGGGAVAFWGSPKGVGPAAFWGSPKGVGPAAFYAPHRHVRK